MASISIDDRRIWERLRERLGKKALVRAGVLEGATNGETGEPIAPYAAYNEFGAAGIPPRAFLRVTRREKKAEWIENLARALRAGRAPQEALDLVGRRMADDIQAKIMSNMPPENSEATRRRKNAEEAGKGTLVDTGSLAHSINYEVPE